MGKKQDADQSLRSLTEPQRVLHLIHMYWTHFMCTFRERHRPAIPGVFWIPHATSVVLPALWLHSEVGFLPACQGAQMNSSLTYYPVFFFMFLSNIKLISLQIQQVILPLSHSKRSHEFLALLDWTRTPSTLYCKQIPVLFSVHWWLLPSSRCYQLFIKEVWRTENSETKLSCFRTSPKHSHLSMCLP